MDLFSDTDPVFLHRDLCAGCYGAGFIKDKGNPISNFVGLLKEISFSSYASVLIGYFMVGMTVPVQVSILPITKPVIFTMALITAIGQWNDFYMPMVFPGDFAFSSRIVEGLTGGAVKG